MSHAALLRSSINGPYIDKRTLGLCEVAVCLTVEYCRKFDGKFAFIQEGHLERGEGIIIIIIIIIIFISFI